MCDLRAAEYADRPAHLLPGHRVTWAGRLPPSPQDRSLDGERLYGEVVVPADEVVRTESDEDPRRPGDLDAVLGPQ
jgi:hypothetical protein